MNEIPAAKVMQPAGGGTGAASDGDRAGNLAFCTIPLN